ncbi:MAG: ABC transporter ATP-binding protein [Clostridia bacterium]|nr:ABC transporter ATP-binding protein [Clostridia bacterium]
MFECNRLKKVYRERVVLEIESLSLSQGETLALAGANGSGKTTLLRILAGNLKPTEGEVRTASPILYLPQRSYAFRGTVLDNVLLGANDQKEEALRLLVETELLPLKDKKASSLSGGELQRLAFCRLLVRPCKLLLLDEPTSACDAAGARLLLAALERYREKHGCTVVLSTHTPVVATQAAKRLIILHNGRIEADGDPQTILQSPSSDWAKEFIAGWRI